MLKQTMTNIKTMCWWNYLYYSLPRFRKQGLSNEEIITIINNKASTEYKHINYVTLAELFVIIDNHKRLTIHPNVYPIIATYSIMNAWVSNNISIERFIAPKDDGYDSPGYTRRYGYSWWFWIPRLFIQRAVCLRGFHNPTYVRLLWLCFAIGLVIGPEGVIYEESSILYNTSDDKLQ